MSQPQDPKRRQPPQRPGPNPAGRDASQQQRPQGQNAKPQGARPAQGQNAKPPNAKPAPENRAPQSRPSARAPAQRPAAAARDGSTRRLAPQPRPSSGRSERPRELEDLNIVLPESRRGDDDAEDTTTSSRRMSLADMSSREKLRRQSKATYAIQVDGEPARQSRRKVRMILGGLVAMPALVFLVLHMLRKDDKTREHVRQTRDQLQAIAQEVERTRFERPENGEDINFYKLVMDHFTRLSKNRSREYVVMVPARKDDEALSLYRDQPYRISRIRENRKTRARISAGVAGRSSFAALGWYEPPGISSDGGPEGDDEYAEQVDRDKGCDGAGKRHYHVRVGEGLEINDRDTVQILINDRLLKEKQARRLPVGARLTVRILRETSGSIIWERSWTAKKTKGALPLALSSRYRHDAWGRNFVIEAVENGDGEIDWDEPRIIVASRGKDGRRDRGAESDDIVTSALRISWSNGDGP